MREISNFLPLSILREIGAAHEAPTEVRNEKHADTTGAPMPKAVTIPKTPSSPGWMGSRNATPTKAAWPRELDDYLRSALDSKRGSEYAAITAVRSSHPELAEDLIWSRIVYLGLTKRKRPLYRAHVWTAIEDGILREKYGRGRAGSNAAIDDILELHPDWSRDAVVWRARTLGLTRHESANRQPWSAALDHQLLSLMGQRVDTIARRLGRSERSVLGRLRRLGWGADFFGGFKAKDLVADLGVTPYRVKKWIRAGWLERKNGRITEESLRALCRYHSDEIPLAALAPETRNWLVRSMDYGRGEITRRGGRRTPATKASASRSQCSNVG